MKKLIVGCGYLGRRVAAAWLAAGHTVTALTRSEKHAAELSKLGVQPVLGDICERGSLVALPAADTILFAVGFDRSSGRSQDDVYVDGLRNVLTTVGAKCRRFLYVSSSSVYGQTDGEWVDETSECRPVQPGGKCCLAAEQLVHEFFSNGVGEVFPDDGSQPIGSERQGVGSHFQVGPSPPKCVEFQSGRPEKDSRPPRFREHGASASILRLAGIYGPDRLLSRIDSLRAREPISGRADAWLNLIHVQDAVSAVLACDERGAAAQTYLVTDDRPVRRGAYYSALAALIDAPEPEFNENEAPKRGAGGFNKRCSNRRLRRDLGVDLQFPSITEGLPEALRGSTARTPSASRPPAG